MDKAIGDLIATATAVLTAYHSMATRLGVTPEDVSPFISGITNELKEVLANYTSK